ncbi:MAG: hypothetical protein H6741_27895 [Alphaproteobacteria bacterium]|nr:hypothetical protein [Alphaproteobacteria bacterium]MCB9796538.1 hypothetical protein [Alphaproteobacteria bacterium]
MTAKLSITLLLSFGLSSVAYADCEGLDLPHSYAAESEALYIFAPASGEAPEVRVERSSDDSVQVSAGEACARYDAASLHHVFVYTGDAAEQGARRVVAVPVEVVPNASAASSLAASTATREGAQGLPAPGRPRRRAPPPPRAPEPAGSR